MIDPLPKKTRAKEFVLNSLMRITNRVTYWSWTTPKYRAILWLRRWLLRFTFWLQDAFYYKQTHTGSILAKMYVCGIYAAQPVCLLWILDHQPFVRFASETSFYLFLFFITYLAAFLSTTNCTFNRDENGSE